MPKIDTAAGFAELTAILEDAAGAAAEGQNASLGPDACQQVVDCLDRKLTEASAVLTRIRSQIGSRS